MLDSRLATWARQSRWARPVGIAAYRTMDRLVPAPPGPKILVNAVPKAGTHLVMGIFDHVPGFRFGGELLWATEVDVKQDDCEAAAERVRRAFARTRPSHYQMGHVMSHPRVSQALITAGVPVTTIVRDPRAIAASAVRYFEENKLRQREIASQGLSREQLAQWLIDGAGELGAVESVPPLAERVRQYLGWLDDPNCIVVKFEDLVGAKGGGSDERQEAAIGQILAFTGVDHLVSAADVAKATYAESSHTFSVGKVRSWESVLTPEQISQVEDETAEFMERLGYQR